MMTAGYCGRRAPLRLPKTNRSVAIVPRANPVGERESKYKKEGDSPLYSRAQEGHLRHFLRDSCDTSQAQMASDALDNWRAHCFWSRLCRRLSSSHSLWAARQQSDLEREGCLRLSSCIRV